MPQDGRPFFVEATVSIAAAAITAVAVAWALGFFWRMGIPIYTEQPLAAMLGLSIFVVFLTRGWSGTGVARPDPVSVLLALVSLGVSLFVAFDYSRLSQDFYFNPVETFIVGSLFSLLTLEALRRVSGNALVIVFAVFFVYALFADLVPGQLQGRSIAVFRLAPILGLDSTALLGTPITVVGTIVIAFILMGRLLFAAGGGNFFTDLAKALMGNTRGGAAKIAVVASAFFGSISGSVVANVTSTGIITIPMMKRDGFKPHVAGAIEAVASNGGQLMPPVMGAAAFLMADFLAISYTQVILAALIPALLYFFAVFMLIDLEAAKAGITKTAEEDRPRLRTVLKEGWFFLIPFAVLLTLMFNYNMSPEAAALFAAGTILLFGFVKGYGVDRLKPSALWDAVVETGKTSVQILVICGVAGMIIAILNVTGLGFALSLLLTVVGESSLLLLLILTAAICIVLGMSMPTTGLYILLATLVVPSLTDLGAVPVAAHFFVFYFGMLSFVTPPVAFAAFAAANLANAPPMQTGWTAMRFSWVAYIIPFLFVYSPSLLMQGDVGNILFSFVTATFGVVCVSAALMGTLKTAIGPIKRLGFTILGLGLLLPGDIAPYALYVNLAAILIAAALLFVEFRGGGAVEAKATGV